MRAPTTTKARFFKSLLHRSIGISLLLSVLAGAFVGLGAMSFLVYQALDTQARNEIRKTLRTEVREIEIQIAQVETFTARVKAAFQIERAHATPTVADCKALTFEFFKQRPTLVMGTGFAQTPLGLPSNPLTGRKLRHDN